MTPLPINPLTCQPAACDLFPNYVVKFQNITVKWRPIDFYRDPQKNPEESLWSGDNLDEILTKFDEKIGDKVWKSQEGETPAEPKQV
jgi:hypothetical protein